MKSNKKKPIKQSLQKQGFFEKYGEKGLWYTRFIVLLAVIFSILSAITLFVIGSWEIIEAIIHKNPITNPEYGKDHNHQEMLLMLITAIDLYLIGVVLLIFGFGIYELFISKIDIAKTDEVVTILEISNLNELKNKIIKVIVMVLIVTFFERILQMSSDYKNSLDMLYFALSIFSISLGVYFIRKHS